MVSYNVMGFVRGFAYSMLCIGDFPIAILSLFTSSSNSGGILMISISIPGFGSLNLAHLVLDYNGTLAVDGEPVPGVIERIERLSQDLEVHVITADTFGTVKQKFEKRPCTVSVLGKENQDQAKLAYVNNLGAELTACIGNGRNDGLMLEGCALGMAVILREGASVRTVQSADLVFTCITDALDILLNPLRLTASLRC